MKQEQRLIEVVSYDVNWPLQFVEEAKLIKHALDANCIEIHHMGSTSVPELSAKPVIDMLPVVLDINKVDAANALMQELGYEAKGEFGIPFRRYFQKGGNQRTHHAHVFELGNPEIERHLKFRDWMRTYPGDREAYARLKQDLAGLHPYDIDSYCLGKEAFIAAIDKKAGFKGLRIVKALTTREWDAVHRFRQIYFFDKADPDTWTFNHEGHVHFVLFQGSDIIGYAHLQLWPKARAALRILIIDKTKRNHQYGSQLLTLCEKWLKSQGYLSLHVQVPAEALKFYQSIGFNPLFDLKPEGYEWNMVYMVKKFDNLSLNSNSITIRTFELADIPQLVEAFQKANWEKPASLFETYYQEQQNAERRIWVAFFKDQIAGYVTLKWTYSYEPFAQQKIPEIMDLNVLPSFCKQGIGSALLTIAEDEAASKHEVIGIGVGLYGGPDGGYGYAQRLYVKRGYCPDGLGPTYNYEPTVPGQAYALDDDLILWFTKNNTSKKL